MDKMFVANKALLFNSEGKLLLLRDAGEGDHAKVAGLWDVPGGRMAAFEHPLEALAREVKEEIGLAIDPADAKLFFVDKWGVAGDEARQPIVGIFWTLWIGSAEVTLSTEHSEYCWIDLDSAPLNVMPSLRNLFDFAKTKNASLVS